MTHRCPHCGAEVPFLVRYQLLVPIADLGDRTQSLTTHPSDALCRSCVDIELLDRTALAELAAGADT